VTPSLIVVATGEYTGKEDTQAGGALPPSLARIRMLVPSLCSPFPDSETGSKLCLLLSSWHESRVLARLAASDPNVDAGWLPVVECLPQDGGESAIRASEIEAQSDRESLKKLSGECDDRGDES
jgi:hypothetical protein